MENKTSLEDLDLSVRSYFCLRDNGVNSVEDLLSKTTDDFMCMRNMRRKSLHEIEMKIKEIKNYK